MVGKALHSTGMSHVIRMAFDRIVEITREKTQKGQLNSRRTFIK